MNAAAQQCCELAPKMLHCTILSGWDVWICHKPIHHLVKNPHTWKPGVAHVPPHVLGPVRQL